MTAPLWQRSAGQQPSDESRVKVQTARLGRFVLLSELGSGGMGSVFAAYDEHLDRKVALKILRNTSAGTAVQRGRTLREARAAARVSHPNVITIYEVGEIDGNIHIAMEHVDGGTLRAWQERSGRSWREILAMYLQAAEALVAAHEAEVVHRDFKPDNVLIDLDERPRVVDFGLARLGWAEEDGPREKASDPEVPDLDSQSSGRLTLPGVISGTPGYMSPEQYRGGNVDSRSDQWSFCAALYEAIYGHLPFSGSTLREHAKSVLGPPSPPPSGLQVPEEIRQALLGGLSPNPEQRFPSMAELIEILRRELREDASSGALSRQRFSRALVIAVFFALAVFQIRYAQLSLTPRAIGPMWLGLIVIVLLGGLWYRELLLRNRFHRDIWIIVLVTSVLCFFQRFIGYTYGASQLRKQPRVASLVSPSLQTARGNQQRDSRRVRCSRAEHLIKKHRREIEPLGCWGKRWGIGSNHKVCDGSGPHAVSCWRSCSRCVALRRATNASSSSGCSSVAFGVSSWPARDALFDCKRRMQAAQAVRAHFGNPGLLAVFAQLAPPVGMRDALTLNREQEIARLKSDE